MAYDPAQFVLAVESIRPVKNMVDFLASDHGEGPYISAWYPTEITQPTQEEIESVDTDALLAAVVPQIISNRQFYHQMTVDGRLSEPEALNAMRGSLSSSLINCINSYYPPEERFGAEMSFVATIFQRTDPTIAAVMQFWNITDEYMDQFFRDASLL